MLYINPLEGQTDAALWFAKRMVIGGEIQIFISPSIGFASEDIGMADPNAVIHAISCWDGYKKIGSPEGDLFLAQSVIYLATAPKSNALYKPSAMQFNLQKKDGLVPPKHMLNAPTELMKNLGYGKNILRP